MRSQWDGRRKYDWIVAVKVKHPISLEFAGEVTSLEERPDGPTRARLGCSSQDPVVQDFVTTVTTFAASGIFTSLRSLPHLVSSWLASPESGVPTLA